MKRSIPRRAIRLVTAGVTTAVFPPCIPCWAAPAVGGLPWDRTLSVLQNFVLDSMAPAIIVLAFAFAGILYALGGHDEQARRLAGSGIGGCVALVIVHLLNYVFP